MHTVSVYKRTEFNAQEATEYILISLNVHRLTPFCYNQITLILHRMLMFNMCVVFLQSVT